MTHDIFLFRGLSPKVDNSIFAKEMASFLPNDLVQKIAQNNPGFLGLNSTIDEAKKIYRHAKSLDHHIQGMILPIKYRDEKPKIAQDEALKIAKIAMDKMQSEYANVGFEPIVFAREELIWYTFCSSSPEWDAKGVTPNGLFVSVDKWDGHVWTDDEMYKLH